LGNNDKKELTTIGRAHEYVREYATNGYNQAKAYQVSHGCSYETAVDCAYRFHKSPAAQQAFEEIIGRSANEYFKRRDGMSIEAEALYNRAKAESLDTALKCLKFIAELMGHIKVGKGDTNIDGRTINVANIDLDKLAAIMDDIKQMRCSIRADNGRQTGEVK
jgi:hypothetical protein